MSKSLEKRFWDKVVKTDYCWNWKAANDGHYGQIYYKGRDEKAHRISWFIHFGDIPKSLLVLHMCDNGFCVNPQHLFLGTQSDNLLDCSRKGRQGMQVHPEKRSYGKNNGAYTQPHKVLRGEKHGRAKLTREEVREIRNKYKKGGISHRKLAKVYNTQYSNIYKILNNQTWREPNERLS